MHRKSPTDAHVAPNEPRGADLLPEDQILGSHGAKRFFSGDSGVIGNSV